jgi:protein-tyrosine kinase
MKRAKRVTPLVTMENPRSVISESYRTLRTNIRFTGVSKTLQTIVFTSAIAEEGKTTTVANVGVVFAQEEKKVLLVDCDLRRPSLHLVFELSNSRGLTNVLVGADSLLSCIQATRVENLSVLTSGLIPPNPSELLGSEAMRHLLDQAKETFDLVLLDTSPVLAVTDAQVLSALADGVVLVIRAGKVRREMVAKTKQRLEHVGAKILGTVLNNKKIKSARYDYNYGSPYP